MLKKSDATCFAKWRHFLLPFCFLLQPVANVLAHGHEHAPNTGDIMERQWQQRLKTAAGTAVGVAVDESGILWSARMRDGHIWVAHSDDNGKTFSEGTKVNLLPEAILADGQNRPMIAVGGGVIAVSWAQATQKLFSGNIRFSRSTDGGKSFSEPATVNDDRQEIGHSFNVMKMSANGELALIWVDSRDRVAAEKAAKGYTGGSIYYVLSPDRGASFSPNVKLADHSCECCRIGLDFSPDGGAVAQWRHVFGTNTRDFAMAQLAPAAKFMRVSVDGWEIDACPHQGGDLSIDETGSRHLVWFTGSPKAPGLFYRRIDEQQLGPAIPFGNPDAQAAYPAVLAQQERIFVVWREYEDNQYRVMMMRSPDRGQTWSTAQKIAASSGAADLPMFISGARKPLLFWSNGDGLQIMDLEKLP